MKFHSMIKNVKSKKKWNTKKLVRSFCYRNAIGPSRHSRNFRTAGGSNHEWGVVQFWLLRASSHIGKNRRDGWTVSGWLGTHPVLSSSLSSPTRKWHSCDLGQLARSCLRWNQYHRWTFSPGDCLEDKKLLLFFDKYDLGFNSCPNETIFPKDSWAIYKHCHWLICLWSLGKN